MIHIYTNTQKERERINIIFLYTNYKQMLRKKSRKQIYNIKKITRINLAKKVKDLYDENIKTLKKETEEDNRR